MALAIIFQRKLQPGNLLYELYSTSIMTDYNKAKIHSSFTKIIVFHVPSYEAPALP
jgi:hypothetical protein